MDFIVHDIEEDEEIPIILGKPFFAIGKSLIDIHERKLILTVGEEQAVFDVYRAINSHLKKMNI